MQERAVWFSVRTKYRTIYIRIINYILSSNQKYIVKNVILLFLLFGIFYSCSKKESTPSTPPVVIKLSGCDSIKQGLLKSTTDTIRLVSCLTINSCDSIRLGILKSKTDSIRLLSCLSINGCDSIRLGVLKPNRQDTLRLLACLKITGCDSIRLGILEPTKSNSERLNCIVTNIGQIYQGGVITYILQIGDPGYDPNVKHGLISSLVNRFGAWQIIPNGNDATKLGIITKAWGKAIGTGLSNTDTIIAKLGKDNAAWNARSYDGGGYTDWFLPSIDELDKVLTNESKYRLFQHTQVKPEYWSSTEAADAPKFWAYFFRAFNLSSNVDDKSGQRWVRPIRYF